MSTQDKADEVPASGNQHGLHMSESVLKMDDVSREAAQATSAEHSMTLSQGIKIYPRAVAWSVMLSTCIVMEGYDTALIQSLIASPPFQETYGSLLPNGTHQLTTSWQTALTLAATVGEIIGLAANGILADRFGYRKTIIGSLVLVTCFIFVVFFAKTPGVLLGGQLLLGLPWGVFQTITVAYASEVCPVPLRAYLTTYVNLCWVIGQLISAGVLRGLVSRNDEWSYRIPFAVQWAWPLPIILGIIFAPESPWWLIRNGHPDKAKASLLRLTSPDRDPSFDVDATLAMMERTNEIEKAMTDGTSYRDCFRGTNLRRTEIVCLTWLTQIWSGIALAAYGTYFYEQAGLAPANAFTLNISQSAIGFVGTLASWVLMSRFGRRTLYLAGLVVMFVVLIITGAVGASVENPKGGWIVGSMILVWTLVYDMTVGPVCYSLVSELASTRLRAKTIVLARCTYNVGAIVISVLTPYMLNPTAWNWGAKSAFFWAGISVVCITWVYFRLPEPKGRTYGELDILFERGISARRFKNTVVVIAEIAAPELLVKEKNDEHAMGDAVGVERI